MRAKSRATISGFRRSSPLSSAKNVPYLPPRTQNFSFPTYRNFPRTVGRPTTSVRSPGTSVVIWATFTVPLRSAGRSPNPERSQDPQDREPLFSHTLPHSLRGTLGLEPRAWRGFRKRQRTSNRLRGPVKRPGKEEKRFHL